VGYSSTAQIPLAFSLSFSLALSRSLSYSLALSRSLSFSRFLSRSLSLALFPSLALALSSSFPLKICRQWSIPARKREDTESVFVVSVSICLYLFFILARGTDAVHVVVYVSLAFSLACSLSSRARASSLTHSLTCVSSVRWFVYYSSVASVRHVSSSSYDMFCWFTTSKCKPADCFQHPNSIEVDHVRLKWMMHSQKSIIMPLTVLI